MNWLKQWKFLLTCLVIILIILVATSLLDILLVFFYPRFYSPAAFIVTFGVGGIFAGVIGYMYPMEKIIEKNETARWCLISMLIITGLIFFFFLAKLEGGEYEPAFKAYGATLALSSLFFVKGKPG
jgi:Na+/melibiose symporter-like transporter